MLYSCAPRPWTPGFADAPIMAVPLGRPLTSLGSPEQNAPAGSELHPQCEQALDLVVEQHASEGGSCDQVDAAARGRPGSPRFHNAPAQPVEAGIEPQA